MYRDDNKEPESIWFRYVSEFGTPYEMKVTREFGAFDEDTVVDLGRVFNRFLEQCGYIREHEYLFMEDVTYEEYDYLTDCLYQYRENKEQEMERKFIEEHKSSHDSEDDT